VRVAVLAGGPSGEHEVSLRSAAAVREGLLAAGHEPVDVEIARDGRWWAQGDPVVLEPGGGLLGCGVVFPALHGPYGEDGVVQGLLEVLAVPYAGAGVLASALCMDKVLFKDLMGSAGIAQVDYVGLTRDDDPAVLERLGLPVFVKPARLGSSVGIAKVSRRDELAGALASAFAHDPLVIVEAMSRGMEVECSVLGDAGRAETSLPGEIVLAGEWYDYEAKYEPGGMQLVVPARLAEQTSGPVRSLARAVFHRTGCSGLARCVFFVEGAGEGDAHVLINELNTIPGFTETSVYAKLFDASGLAYPELLDRLLAIALERHQRARAVPI
jgi:D-alanine-D-alanine ligase